MMERMILNQNDARTYRALEQRLDRGWKVRSARALTPGSCRLWVAPAGDGRIRPAEDDPEERDEA